MSQKVIPYLLYEDVAAAMDADAHYERAKAAGATILAAPADQPYGDRSYRVEGAQWA